MRDSNTNISSEYHLYGYILIGDYIVGVDGRRMVRMVPRDNKKKFPIDTNIYTPMADFGTN